MFPKNNQKVFTLLGLFLGVLCLPGRQGFAKDVVPLGSLSPDVQKRVLLFAKGPLRRFSSLAFATPRDFEEAIVDVSLAAAKTFHSPLITEGFNKLGSLSLDVRLKEKELDLIDAKDRLNNQLHAWGIHLVLDPEKLEQGQINLSAYLIDRQHSYDVLKTPFLMYEVQPLIEHEFYPVLGHAEVDQGYLLLFAQTINQEVEMTQSYLNNENQSFFSPNLFLTTATIRLVDILARDALSETTDLRARFIDTVGHHEGYHKYIEPTLAEAVRRGFITETEKSVLHETGAYLYQLESSDERFTALDLVVILATALNDAPGHYPNKEGAHQALLLLQPAVDWDERGWLNLFKMSASSIKSAAGLARQRYEIDARNGGRR